MGDCCGDAVPDKFEKTLSERLVPWLLFAAEHDGGLVFNVKHEPGKSGESGGGIEISHDALGEPIRFWLYEYLPEGKQEFDDEYGPDDRSGPPDARQWPGLGDVVVMGGGSTIWGGYDSLSLGKSNGGSWEIEVGRDYGMLRLVPRQYEGWWAVEWSVAAHERYWVEPKMTEDKFWDYVAFMDLASHAGSDL